MEKLTPRHLRTIFAHIGIQPNETQWPIFEWAADQRFTLVAGGERAGKSLTAALWLSAWVVVQPAAALIWIIGAEYEDAKPEFRYTDQILSAFDLVASVSTPKQGGWELVTKTGVRIVTKSAKDPTKLGREAPDGILMCEAGRHSYESYLRILGRVAEKRAWVWISGTFEDSTGWYPETFNTWQGADARGRSFSLPTWSNTDVFPQGMDTPEIQDLKREFPPDRFKERFAGVPVPPKGLVFKEFTHAAHVHKLEFLADLPVYLWVDPGYAGAYAVEVVQLVSGFVRVFDEIYRRFMVTDEIIDICLMKPWWNNVEDGVIDIAARQHQAQESVLETWQEKTGLLLNNQEVGIIDGIDRVRSFLRPHPVDRKPRLMVDVNCKGLIGEMTGVKDAPFHGGYKYKLDKDGAMGDEKPVDKHNHACKALAYGLVWHFALVDRKKRKTELPKSPGIAISQVFGKQPKSRMAALLRSG